jgi:hypothetical protein
MATRALSQRERSVCKGSEQPVPALSLSVLRSCAPVCGNGDAGPLTAVRAAGEDQCGICSCKS